MIDEMEMESLFIQTEISTKESGKITSGMERELTNSSFQMEQNMLEIGTKEKTPFL